ncbi:transposase-like protein [Stemphylium lycopersici]|nr:transposase-like protein [Stemphylium lycopersici]
MKLWRSKGPIDKLHNIVHWVQRSGQRIEKLHKLQLLENTALNLGDKITYNVITDNATRWNSSEAMMERGYQLRNAPDSMVQAEATEWNQYVVRRTQNGTKPMPNKSRKKPAIVDDKMSAKDWSMVSEYLALLKPLKTATKRLEGRPKEVRRKAAVQQLWEEHRILPVERDTIPEQPIVTRKTTDLDGFMASIRKPSTQPAPLPSATHDEYTA